MSRNFHDQKFDAGTLVKLDIYRRYLQSWLPVFIQSQKLGQAINVFDFFAGPGSDKSGADGSPVIAVRTALEYSEKLIQKNKKVFFYFFDAGKRKTAALRENLKEAVGQEHSPIRVSIECKPFSDALAASLPTIKSGCNLIFVDQCGIKQVTPEIFRALTSCPRTDLLFFSASSYLRRFAGTKEFLAHLDLNVSEVNAIPHSEIHRFVAGHYKAIARKVQSDYYVAPFSIKKDSNIYGLIFGSGHLLGLDKFLRVCWEIDSERGEANYDIDGDGSGPTPFIFPEWNTPGKLRRFREDLRKKLLDGQLRTDADVNRFALESGFLGSQAREVVTEMFRKGCLAMRKKSVRPRLSVYALSEPREFVTLNREQC